MHDWYVANREKRLAQVRAYRQAHRDEINARQLARRQANPPKPYVPSAEQVARYRARDREKRPWSSLTAEQKAEHRARTYAWRAANPMKVDAIDSAQNANRRAKAAGVAGRLRSADVLQLWERQPMCADCGVGRGVDHVVSMRKSGTNTPDNIQNLCRPCNSRKEALAMHAEGLLPPR